VPGSTLERGMREEKASGLGRPYWNYRLFGLHSQESSDEAMRSGAVTPGVRACYYTAAMTSSIHKQTTSMQNHSSSLRTLLEISAVIATGILHLVFTEVFQAPAWFIGLAVASWAIYIVVRVRRDGSALSSWGFRSINLRKTVIATSVVAAVAIFAMIRISNGALFVHWHMLPLLLLYPIWGVIQQFLVQAMVVDNLSLISRRTSFRWMVIILAATLFGLVHIPDVKLMAATFCLGMAFTPIYLRWRNLWPLGIYHGWLGVIFYFWVLHRDPWLEVLGSL
jgi:CAAX prenyl protease-like protein